VIEPSRGVVVAVSSSPTHTMTKPNRSGIQLIAGRGVADDAHMGEKVKHRSRVARDPDAPNLRQVHLIHAELHEELAASGFAIAPGQMGENITTRGLDLLALPTGTRLHLGHAAIIEITGLRNPCHQLDGIAPGLMAATLARGEDGRVIRKAGAMAIVVAGGEVKPGAGIGVEMPAGEHRALAPV